MDEPTIHYKKILLQILDLIQVTILFTILDLYVFKNQLIFIICFGSK